MFKPWAFISVVLHGVVGCGSGGEDPPMELGSNFDDGVCSPGEDRAFIRQISKEWYLYPNQLRDLQIEDFENASDYLQALLANVDLAPDNLEVEAKDRFSYVTTLARAEVISTGNFVGLGVSFSLEKEAVDGERALRLTDVLGATERENPAPAGEAGLNRGDRIVAINGESIENIIDENRCGRGDTECERSAINVAFGPSEEGSAIEFTVVQPDGSRFDTTVVRRFVEQTEVPVAQVFERSEDRRVGYFVFRGFKPSSAEDLRRMAAEFEEQGVTDLIIDLRYNGGGRAIITSYLGNLIYGVPGDGEVFFRRVYNEQRSDQNTTTLFEQAICPQVSDCEGATVPLSGVESLTFITTGSSASASELLINGLSPYLPVQIVGSPTFGKPVGSLVFVNEDCDQAFSPISSKALNAEGIGDYFNGFAVDCPAEDDTTRRFGDENEASLAAALALVDGEPCPTSAAQARALRSAARRAEHRSYTELLDALRWQ